MEDQTKAEWIQAKIKKLIEEGKDPDQAAAIAHSMWEDQHQEMSGRVIKVPFFPVQAGSTIDGRSITDEIISDLKSSYNPARKAPVYVSGDGPEHGDSNAPALGIIQDIVTANFGGQDFLTAIALETNGSDLDEVAGPAGKYPNRSVDISKINGKWTVEGIALLGAKRPAVYSLPDITLNSTTQRLTFSLTGGHDMPDEKFETLKKELEEKFTAERNRIEEQFKTELKKQDERYSAQIALLKEDNNDLRLSNAAQSANQFIMENRNRITPADEKFEHEGMKLRDILTHADIQKISFTVEDKTVNVGEWLRAYFKARPEIKTATVGPKGKAPAVVTPGGIEQQKMAAIREVVEELKLDRKDPEQFAAAMDEAERRHPELFAATEEVN